MNLYTIVLKNTDQNSIKRQTVKKITFPEAAMAANMLKANLGFEWEIISIVKKER